MPWLLARHSTNEGVLRSNSAQCCMMSDDLRLPRRGIEPRPSGFRDIGSTARPSPLPSRYCPRPPPPPRLRTFYLKSEATQYHYHIHLVSNIGPIFCIVLPSVNHRKFSIITFNSMLWRCEWKKIKYKHWQISMNSVRWNVINQIMWKFNGTDTIT